MTSKMQRPRASQLNNYSRIDNRHFICTAERSTRDRYQARQHAYQWHLNMPQHAIYMVVNGEDTPSKGFHERNKALRRPCRHHSAL